MARLAEVYVRALRLLAGVAGGRGVERKLLVLSYHRVHAEEDPLFGGAVTAAAFSRQMDLLRRVFTPLTLARAARLLRSAELPPRAVCVTFDDGYEDNYSQALPILRAQGVPATFFVASGFLDGGCMWNDTIIESLRYAKGPTIDLRRVGLAAMDIETPAKRQELIDKLIGELKYLPMTERKRRADDVAEAAGRAPPADLMMTSDQVKSLHSHGMEIGAHTVNHPILSALDDKEAEWEIVESRNRLERLVGDGVRSFAYPNGRPLRDYLPKHVTMVREAGFGAAVSTAWGFARWGDDQYQIRRIVPWEPDPARLGLHLLKAYFQRSAVPA